MKNIEFKITPKDIATAISNGKWFLAKHLELINEKLIKIAKREIKRLIINMPPRHGKSEFISHYFPFWYLGNFPDENIMFTTYSQHFANHFGKRLRNLFKEFGKTIFNLELDKDYRSANEIKTTSGRGSLYLVGSGGSLTGRGADLIIIDDPIKNQADAMSEIKRENLWDWFFTTAYTRLEPQGAVIIVMTRWHDDDLCGRLIEQEKDKWEILSLPAIAEGINDPIGRKIGEPLWEERFDINILNERKQSMGAVKFSGLYQQKPMPSDGAYFIKSQFKYFTVNEYYYLLDGKNNRAIIKDECTIYSTMDLAMSEAESADYTALITFAITPQNAVLILDILREKVRSDMHIKIIEENYNKFKPQMIGIESVQYQTSLINLALNQGLPVKSLSTKGKKEIRILPIINLLSNGKVYFLQNAHWLMEFEKELLSFPKGRHDDQVDAFGYINEFIIQHSNFEVFGIKRKSENNRWG